MPLFAFEVIGSQHDPISNPSWTTKLRPETQSEQEIIVVDQGQHVAHRSLYKPASEDKMLTTGAILSGLLISK
jgi:hypothetical protein